MRNGFMFSAARASALASLLCLPILELADRPAAWAAAPAPGPVQITLDGPFPGNPVAWFLEDFWAAAWGLDFAINQSGITIEGVGTPGVWDLFVHQQLQTVATGQYFEIVSLALPGPVTAPAGGPGSDFAFEQLVTAGLLFGAGGFSSPVYGLRQHISGSAAGEPFSVDAFTPLGRDEDLNTVLNDAANLHRDLTAGEPEEDDDPFELDPCSCDETYGNEISACFAEAIACQAECTAVAMLALAGCLALGPFAAPCMAAVTLAHVACIAKCLARQRACNKRAKIDHLNCWESCEAEE